MTTKKETSVRGRKHAARDSGEHLDQTPIELPMGAVKGLNVAQQIQQQIAIQLAKKSQG